MEPDVTPLVTFNNFFKVECYQLQNMRCVPERNYSRGLESTPHVLHLKIKLENAIVEEKCINIMTHIHRKHCPVNKF